MDVRPGLVEQGRVTELRVELPQLRPGPAPRRLEVEGEGIDVLSTRLQGLAGPETRWTVRLRAAGPPRVTLLVLRAVFADGESVEVDSRLTVVPPVDEGSFPWAAAGVGVFLALGLAAGALVFARHKA